MTKKQTVTVSFKEKGATLIEYAVLAGLIVIVALASIKVIGNTVSSQFSTIANSL